MLWTLSLSASKPPPAPSAWRTWVPPCSPAMGCGQDNSGSSYLAPAGASARSIAGTRTAAKRRNRLVVVDGSSKSKCWSTRLKHVDVDEESCANITSTKVFPTKCFMLRLGVNHKLCYVSRRLIWTERFTSYGDYFGFYTSTGYLVCTRYFAPKFSSLSSTSVYSVSLYHE